MSFPHVLRRRLSAIAGRALVALAVVLALGLFSIPSFAQLNLGRIFGAITDQTGGAVVGAAVSVIDVARGITRPLVTDGAGQYDAGSLIPGTYTVRAEQKGFKAAEHTDIEVGVGKEVRVDFTLQPGEQTTTVTVTGDLPLINTTNATLGATLENISVQELPMNGRNYQYLAWTRPGIVMAPTEGQQDFSTDGMNVVYVLWMIDGVSDSNLFVGGPSLVGGAETAPAGGLDQQTIMPADAIQEVNMIENPQAEYGDKSGAHIDVGLKSGTNSLHGTATAFGRDDKLNAKNPFLTSNEPKAPLTLEQFAGSVGGPIKKDKMFFFADYEGQRYTSGVPKLQNLPTVADLSAPALNLTALQQATFSVPDAISAVAKQWLAGTSVAPNPLSINLGGCAGLTTFLGATTTQTAYTVPQLTTLAGMNTGGPGGIASFCKGNPLFNIFGNANVPGAGLGPGQIITDFFTSGGSDNGIIKIDYHPNDHNSLNWEWYSGGGDTTSAAFSQQYWSADFHTWANMGRAVWVWTPNATWLNEFRFGYDYGNFPDYSNECDHGTGPNYAALGFVDGARTCSFESGGPGRDIWGGFPLLTITGFGNNSDNSTTGGSNTMQDNFEHYYTILDNASWTHGKHNIKFGTEVRLLYMNAAAMQFNQGTINFTNSTVNAFAGATPLDNYIGGVAHDGLILDGDPNRKEYVPTMEFYIQDSWRVTPRITLNYGLRYEFTWPWTNPGTNPAAPGLPAQPAHLWANFNSSMGTATDLVQETSGHPVYHEYPWNFGPRIGIAWDVLGDGKTVVHTGLAVMQDSAPRGIQVVFGGGAELNAVPTGFEFYDVAYTGCAACGPGNTAVVGTHPGTGFNYLGENIPVGGAPPANTIQTTTISFTAPPGTGPGTKSALPFLAGTQAGGTPVYPSAQNGAFTCGDGIVSTVINGNPITPPLCSPQVFPPIYHMPYYLSYSLSIQHAFTNNWTTDIAYVGNSGDDIDGQININTPLPGGNSGGGCPVGGNAAVEQCRRPYNGIFPFYQNIILDTGFIHANYNALQASVTHRLSHGLQITPAFTWQHTLIDGANENPYDPQLSWGSTGNPIAFTITGTYYIPNIKTPAQLLEGWEINSTVYMLHGPAATITDSADDFAGNGQADTWNITGNPRSFKLGSVGHPIPCYGIKGSTFGSASNCTVVSIANPVLADLTNCNTPSTIKNAADAALCDAALPAACINAAANAPTNASVLPLNGGAGVKNDTGLWALANVGCYLTGNPISPQGVLTPPAQGTFGDEGYGTMYGKGFENWDFSLLKNWKFKERYSIQFRAEFFNILNRTLVYGAGGTSGNSPSTLGQLTSLTDSSNPVIGNGVRKIQFGLKIGF